MRQSQGLRGCSFSVLQCLEAELDLSITDPQYAMYIQLTWEAEILSDCSFQVMVKKVSPEHRQLLENSSYDHCQKKLILLSARGFTNLFQILVKVKKVKCLNPALIFHLFLILLC